ncbi:O-antigen ligase family protein [Calycomorphotria hydatis]|uniref:O-Antigen ligase n=1 Tax=Calycomorphotria hydatis TaxID=2528027 RepID=A0A517T3D8_9PLAN|nr:O-antigen ligase family protein [Calycomorphotria hydatis]QDT62892.1 O-Antigen ligase [Calycomorphotria hydatis]
MGYFFVYALLAFFCLGGLYRPYIGVLGYYVFVLLQPEWNWRWSIPQGSGFQKYIAIAAVVGFVLHFFPGNRIRRTPLWACVALTVFLGLAYLSSIWSINPSLSQWYLGNIWKIVLLALLTVRVFDSSGKILALIWSTVLAQSYNAFQINLQYFQEGYSYAAKYGWGTSGDNNLYSILTVPMIGLTAALATESRVWWQKGIAGVILILQIHQIMLMESRGCMLGTLVMMALAGWWMRKDSMNLIAAALVVLAGIVLAGPPVIEEFTSAFEAGDNLDASAESRFKLWKAGLAITQDYPLLGVGPYAGSNLVPSYYEGGLEGSNKALHNLFFEISTGCGVPAMLCYCFFFVAIWWSLWRLWRRSRRQLPDWARIASLGVMVGLPGYWVSSMFSSGALLETSYLCAAMGGATLLVVYRDAARQQQSSVMAMSSYFVPLATGSPQPVPETTEESQPTPPLLGEKHP